MKASTHFVDTITTGIRLLRAKYGAEAIAQAGPWTLFHTVGDSCRPGMTHNAKVEMPLDEAFHREAMNLNDAHIETAIKAAIRQA